MNNSRRVVVTGLGTISPVGSDTKETWQALCAGRSGIRHITAFDASRFQSRIAGEVANFRPEDHLDARLAKRVDRFTQFALVASDLAVTDAGLDLSREDPNRVGVIVGSGIGGLLEIEHQHTKLLQKGPERISAFMIPKLMVNAASGQISIRYGLRGPNSAIATACASASNAIGDAFKIIQWGEADIMIAGGSEAAITPLGLAGFCSMKALSRRNDEPERASRPFDRDRDGFVLGEGAGIVILEEYEHALKRSARIYAEVLGYGMSGDGRHITAPDPEGLGAALSMENALRDSRLRPQDITYINAHGTSTPLGDRAETIAIKKVFNTCAKKLMISSTKSMIGHLLGASGGVEFIAVILSIADDTIHPTINYENPDPLCDLDYVPNTARKVTVKSAMSNSFGFGGHNATLVACKLP